MTILRFNSESIFYCISLNFNSWYEMINIYAPFLKSSSSSFIIYNFVFTFSFGIHFSSSFSHVSTYALGHTIRRGHSGLYIMVEAMAISFLPKPMASLRRTRPFLRRTFWTVTTWWELILWYMFEGKHFATSAYSYGSELKLKFPNLLPKPSHGIGVKTKLTTKSGIKRIWIEWSLQSYYILAINTW